MILFLALGYKSSYIKNYFKKRKYKNIKIKLIDTGKKFTYGGQIAKTKKLLCR